MHYYMVIIAQEMVRCAVCNNRAQISTFIIQMDLATQERDSLLAPITRPSNLKAIAKKRLGFDMNNQIGTALQEIRNICNKLEKSPHHLRMNIISDIKFKQQKVVEEFMHKIYLVLEHEARVVAVFDGAKTQKIKQIKPYLLQQKKLNRLSQKDVKDYLKSGSLIQQIFYKRQYNMEESQIYWQVYEETIQCIIINIKMLEQYGAQVFVAPYEADIQLVKLYSLGQIDMVVSNDKDYVNHGVPLISKLEKDGKFQIINVCTAELEQNRHEHPYKFIKQARENPMKHAMFVALSGSKHLPKLKSHCNKYIPTTLLIQIIENTSNLGQVFKKLQQNYRNFVITPYYEELAELTMIVELLSPYYNPKSGKVECANRKALQMIKDRQLNLENLHKIWNQHYTKDVREGFVNISTNHKREFYHQVFGKSL